MADASSADIEFTEFFDLSVKFWQLKCELKFFKIFLNSDAAILYNHKSSYPFHLFGGSSSGRTWDSDSHYGGSNPSPPAIERTAVTSTSKTTKRNRYCKNILYFTACRNAGLKDLRIHDLRHVFASKMVMNGTSLYITGELLGHRTPNMTKRYSHLVPDTLRKAVNDVWKK